MEYFFWVIGADILLSFFFPRFGSEATLVRFIHLCAGPSVFHSCAPLSGGWSVVHPDPSFAGLVMGGAHFSMPAPDFSARLQHARRLHCEQAPMAPMAAYGTYGRLWLPVAAFNRLWTFLAA